MNIPVLMGKKWLLPALVIGAVVVVGAGIRWSGERAAERALERATGGDADIDVNGDDVTVKTDEGQWSTGGEVPRDWPADVPVYGGAKVLYSASSNPSTGAAGSYLGLQSSDAPDKVAEFYRRELPAKGWNVTSTATVNGGTYLGAEKDGRELSVAVTPADSGSSIMLGVAEKQ